MLEHVNNLMGIKYDGQYPIIEGVAVQALESWAKFTSGEITREQLESEIDQLLAPELVATFEMPDSKFQGYMVAQLEGLKTQDPENHMPGTIFDVQGQDVTYTPSTTFSRSDPIE